MEEEIEKIRSDRNLIMGVIITIGLLICIFRIIFGIDNMAYRIFRPKHNCQPYIIRMSQQEKDIYNARVKKYIGEQVKGLNVIYMIETIMSMNLENINITGRFISIEVEKIEDYDEESKKELEELCKKCNYYENEKSDNSEENVREVTQSMKILKSIINSSKKYKVEEKYEDGIIYKVKISESDKLESNKKGKKDE